MDSSCPLCNQANTFEFHNESKGHRRRFFKCNCCKLVFADPNQLLNSNIEKSRYENHKNSEKTDGYIKFLETLINPMKKYITREHRGLDFGSGPYPMLVETLKNESFQIEGFDPYFANDEKLLKAKYDYVFCCEVSEHFNFPLKSFMQLFDLVNQGGVIGLKTTLLADSIDFSTWYYKSDDTHVSFYSRESMEWIATNFNLKILEMDETVIILRKL